MFKKLFSHTAIYGLAPQVPKIAGILALPIITQFLTDIDFGVYGIITAVVGSISVFGSLGLNLILSNAFYHSPGHYKWGWRQIYGFLILWNIPYAGLLSILLYFFIPNEAIKDAFWIIILNVAPIVFFGPTSILGNYYYQLNQRPLQIGVRSALFGTLSVGLNILFIAGMEMGYMGWFLSACISTMLSQLSYWWPLNIKLGVKPIFNFKWRYIRNSLKVSMPIVPHYYSGYLIDSSDQMIMKLMNVSTGNIGLYNVANRIAILVKHIGIAAGKAVTPMMYEGYKNNDQKTPRRLVFTLQIIFLCMTFLLSIWLKEVFNILINNESLTKIYPLGVIMVMAYNYRPMYYGANNRLFYSEKTKVLLKITFIGGILNVILNIIFIKLIGFHAAAYTTFACLMYIGYAGYYLKEFREANSLNYYPLFWLILTIVLTITAYYVVEFYIWTKVVISLFLIMLSFFGLRKLGAE